MSKTIKYDDYELDYMIAVLSNNENVQLAAKVESGKMGLKILRELEATDGED